MPARIRSKSAEAVTPPAPPSDPPPPPEAPLPDIGGRPRGTAAQVKVPYAPAYYLAWHPARWQVMRGRVVPRLRKISLTPGANGVDRDSKQRPVPTLAVAQAEQEGFTVLPWKVDGEPYIQPIVKEDVSRGWMGRHESAPPGADRTIPDEEAYAAWCASLVERGIIDEPPDYALAAMQEAMEARYGRYEDSGKSAYSARMKRLKEDIDAVKRYREKLAAARGPASTDLPELGA